MDTIILRGTLARIQETAGDNDLGAINVDGQYFNLWCEPGLFNESHIGQKFEIRGSRPKASIYRQPDPSKPDRAQMAVNVRTACSIEIPESAVLIGPEMTISYDEDDYDEETLS